MVHGITRPCLIDNFASWWENIVFLQRKQSQKVPMLCMASNVILTILKLDMFFKIYSAESSQISLIHGI